MRAMSLQPMLLLLSLFMTIPTMLLLDLLFMSMLTFAPCSEQPSRLSALGVQIAARLVRVLGC